MNRYRPAEPDDLDPELLLTAAHELGHAIVDLAHDVPVLSVEVDRRTNTGLTRVVNLNDPAITPDHLRGALIARLAGFEAELLWCRRHGGHADLSTARTDYAEFNRHRRAFGLTRAVARAQARAVLIRHWPRLERLALRLAQRGHVDLGRV